MFNSRLKSESHANSALILGHVTSGMGEKSLTYKFSSALTRLGYSIPSIVDLVEWMGEDFSSLAELNYALADGDQTVLENIRSFGKLPKCDLLLILSWSFGLAAAYASGVHKSQPTAVKLFAHHVDEKVLTRLYEPADLLITESLLAHERGVAYGLDEGKMLYMPHTYPKVCSTLSSNRAYAQTLAWRLGKALSPTATIFGCVSRFEYGKNCEFAVEAVRQLVERGKEAVLILKGHFPEHSPYPEYRERFFSMLQAYKEAPWLLWDDRRTPYPEVLHEYASFDALIHPSGAEGGSHVIVECLGLQKPVVALECSTNPSLFKGLVNFSRPQKQIQHAQLPFYYPDLAHLIETLEQDLVVPSKAKVEARFHEENLDERIPLLFDRDPSKLKKLYEQDRKLYGD